MKRSLPCLGLLALAGLAAAPARAESPLRLPFLTARVRQPAPDLPPPTAVPAVPAAPAVPAVPGEPLLEPPLPVPGPPGPPGPVLKPMTPAEFVDSFKPLPGKYEVLLIHPSTGCPVKVCFTLPPGCVRKVRVNAHKIEFVYSCHCNVVIRFLCTGKVWVRG